MTDWKLSTITKQCAVNHDSPPFKGISGPKCQRKAKKYVPKLMLTVLCSSIFSCMCFISYLPFVFSAAALCFSTAIIPYSSCPQSVSQKQISLDYYTIKSG